MDFGVGMVSVSAMTTLRLFFFDALDLHPPPPLPLCKQHSKHGWRLSPAFAPMRVWGGAVTVLGYSRFDLLFVFALVDFVCPPPLSPLPLFLWHYWVPEPSPNFVKQMNKFFLSAAHKPGSANT